MHFIEIINFLSLDMGEDCSYDILVYFVPGDLIRHYNKNFKKSTVSAILARDIRIHKLLFLMNVFL